ncbi:MAG: LpqB family beta-propeller domain-containing protein [Actinoplanes sp.]
MRRLLITAALSALLLAGCGIPSDTDVTVIGPAPEHGASAGDDGVLPPQYTRDSTTDPALFVDYYLQAAAGIWEGALNRVKAFQSPDFASSFDAAPDVRVVRLAAKPLYTPGNDQIKISVQQVGTLKGNGLLEPEPDPRAKPDEYTLQVGTLPGQTGLFITKAPKMMLLADTALNDFYQRRTIYFWNTEKTGLVPDLRYMPLSVPTVQQPTTILGWLANGPAPWISDVVESLPQGTTAPDNVPAIAADTLRISLSVEAVPPNDDKAMDRLRRQLQWSLRPLAPRILELKIGHQDPVRYVDAEYYGSNAAYQLADKPERFVVFNGAIRRLANTPHADDPVPLLKPAANRSISTAALSTSGTHTFAAVVTTSGKAQTLRVAIAPNGNEADLKPVGGLSGSLGRPVWAVTTGGDAAGSIGLIIANGKLYSFSADGSKAQPVQWQGDPGPITAVSVAPDGHRVAVVARGKLYRTVLNTGGEGLALDAPEELLPPTLTTVAAVAWSSETFLAVAGKRSDDRYTVLDVTVDGALPYTLLSDIGDEQVSYLTAYPANPVTREENSDSESYMAGGAAWDVIGDPVRITVADMVPQPGTPPAGAVPTQPFFLD